VGRLSASCREVFQLAPHAALRRQEPLPLCGKTGPALGDPTSTGGEPAIAAGVKTPRMAVGAGTEARVPDGTGYPVMKPLSGYGAKVRAVARNAGRRRGCTVPHSENCQGVPGGAAHA
jgi:hypothetical protein